jgi:uncharacterized protein YkwD
MSISVPSPRRLVATVAVVLLVPAVTFADTPRGSGDRASATPVRSQTRSALEQQRAPAGPTAAPVDRVNPTAPRPAVHDYVRESITLPTADDRSTPTSTTPDTTRSTTPNTTRSTAPTTAGKPAKPKHKAVAPAGSGHTSSSMAASVLAQLNSQRRGGGLPALRMNGDLITSAHRHNLAMAAANQMSHQLPGEAYFADRIVAAGYDYRNAGENIGWNADISTAGVLALGTTMFNEGPGGGHYENIMDRHFKDVGVDVYVDTQNHVVWLTEDFGGR